MTTDFQRQCGARDFLDLRRACPQYATIVRGISVKIDSGANWRSEDVQRGPFGYRAVAKSVSDQSLSGITSGW